MFINNILIILFNIKVLNSTYMNNEEKIPKDIILTWKDTNVPKNIIEKWQILNPEFKIKFFTDKKIIDFLHQEYNNIYVNFFKNIKFGRYKADFFRYCYLYKHGGYYFDIDIEPMLPIKEILDIPFHYCTVLSTMKKHIFQAVLIVNKNDPILKMCIDDMLYYGSNIGIDPPDIPPYHGHPTRCMYDNIVKYTETPALNDGIINVKNKQILLGKEIIQGSRIAIKLNHKIFGYSRYKNYNRETGFQNIDM